MKRKTFLLLILLNLIVSTHADATDVTINMTDVVNATNHQLTSGDVTVKIAGTCSSNTDGTATLNATAAVVVSVSGANNITQISLGTYTTSGGSIGSDTYNGTVTDAGVWTPKTGKNAGCVFLAVNGSGAVYVQAKTITVTYVPGTTTWITPTITLSQTNFENAFIGDGKFDEPSVTIKDGETNISNRFFMNYFMVGQNLADVTTDPVTGTSVTRRYGQVTVGDKAGTATVVVATSPVDKYANVYNMTYTKYTIQIPKIAPAIVTSPSGNLTAMIGTNQWGGAVAQTIPFPLYTITYTGKSGAVVDVSSLYTCTCAKKSGDDCVSIDATNKTLTATAAGTEVLTFTYTPANTDAYNTLTVDKTITVGTLEKGTTIPLTVTFPKTDVNMYWGANGVPQAPVVRDAYGNDVTKYVTLSYSVVEPNTYNTHVYSSTAMQAGSLKQTDTKRNPFATDNVYEATTSTISCAATINSWSQYSAIYASSSVPATYTLHNMPRVPAVVITPDPSTIKVQAGEVMDFNNRFDVKGAFTDETTGKVDSLFYNQAAFYYTFEFKSEQGITVSGLSGDRKATVERDGEKWEVCNSIKGWGTDNLWKITFANTGTFQVIYRIYPYNYPYYSDGVGSSYSYTVQVKVTPTVKVTPDTVVVYTGDTKFPEPIVSVTNSFGADISSNYHITYSVPENTNGVSVVDNKVTLGTLAVGSVAVTATATPIDAEKYESGTATYVILIKDGSNKFGYEIVSTEGTDYGKMRFTRAGAMSGGTYINGVPGCAIRFGKNGDDDWGVALESTGRWVSTGAPAQVNSSGIPVSGTFYTFIPSTNGFITVDATYQSGNKVVMVDSRGGEIEQETYTPATGVTGEHAFRYPLMAGTTYYLYNAGDNVYYEPLALYGYNYSPAYLNSRADDASRTAATAFVNGYAGSLPTIVTQKTDNVTFAVSFDADNTGETVTDYATVSDNGVVSPLKGTSGLKSDSRVQVTASVVSGENSSIVKTASYKLLIADIPTYFVPEDYTPMVGEQVSTTNYPTYIKMTFGGWDDVATHPYNKASTSGELTRLVDSWKIAKMDSVGRNDMTIDGFKFHATGANNAYDEQMGIYDGTKTSHTSFDLPCRGSYVRFEPAESGTLAVYVLQNGCVDYGGDPATSSSANKVKWRPLFITDESGAAVPLTSWENTPSATGTSTDAYTEGISRCSESEITFDWSDANATKYKTVIEGGWKTKGATQSVVKANGTDGKQGYFVVCKAYVRYTFKVKAGKSYYVQMGGSKLGFCGFAFMPEGWSPGTASSAPTAVSLSDATAIRSTSDVTYDKKVTVTLNRTFTKGQWSSICLPFSVKESKFKSIFGDDALIITFNQMRNDSALFTQHVYHMIEAGRPYFIRPSKDVTTALVVDSVTIEGTSSPSVSPIASDASGGFSFKGIYDGETMNAYSYYIKGTTTGTGGELRWYSAAKDIKGYRAYLSNVDSSPLAKINAFGFGNVDDEIIPTGIKIIIDGVNEDMSTQSDRRVYNMNGQEVRRSSEDLNGLAKGIYIMNGKKVVVK